ncbi:hypothetical protein KI387_001922 [Taxus chinensis]|uniref:Uncharacterized protein n=1 Tax=Taxus chinensis TaxID=29808 RepID=A0AA38GTY4_TAXCH|nr:hypothetical protein KI387_001922 [Taxus chinensis]
MDQITRLLATKTPTEFRLSPSSNAAAKNWIVTNRSPYIGRSTTLNGSSSNAQSLCVRALPINRRRRRIYSSKIEPIDYTQEFHKRSSVDEVCEEIQKCYQLVHKLGRGVVYLASSRTRPNHPHFLQATELGREV